MVYAERYNLATPAVAGEVGGVVEWRLNDIFSPRSTWRPYGYDEMAALYKRYKVTKAIVEFTILSEVNDTIALWRIGPAGDTATMAGGYVHDIMARPGTGYTFVSNSGAHAIAIRREFNIHDLLGVTKLQYESDVSEYASLIGASPARSPVLRIGAANAITAAVADIMILIKISYVTDFWDRTIVSNS